ncbi:MAG: hypothetical protein ACFFFH_20655 [Candidatus Thorarchaeota archaeon]
MGIDYFSESKIKRFVPKHQARSALWWVFQRVSGFFLFFFIIFHMLVNHYLTALLPTDIREFGVASFEAVQWKMQYTFLGIPLYLVISFCMVTVLVFHMLNGFRTVILDLTTNQTFRKLIAFLLIIIGLLAITYTLWLNLTVASI